MAANLSIETTGNAIHEQVLRLVWTWFDLFDLLELATVCKRWSMLVNNTVADIGFKHIALPLGYSNRAFDVWSRIRYSDVESLSMTTANGSAADVHSMFARAPTTLRSVQLTSRNGGDRLSSYDTLALQSRLQQLCLKNVSIPPSSLHLIYALTELRDLYIESREHSLPLFTPQFSALRALESLTVICPGARGTLEPIMQCTSLKCIIITVTDPLIRSLEFVDSVYRPAVAPTYGTGLFGPIPESIGNLVQLKHLVIAGTRITGTIPATIGNLTNLEALELRNCELVGRIPPAISQLTNLKELHLHANILSGRLPPGISELTNLVQLTLHLNRFTGPIPSGWTTLTQLKRLSLRENQLTGVVPPLNKLPQAMIVASDNSDALIQGAPPAQEVRALQDFFYAMDGQNWDSNAGWNVVVEARRGSSLAQRSCNLAGITILGDDEPHVRSLWFPASKLRGRLPASIGNLVHLRGIGLWDNLNITGTIPSSISKLRSLLYLYLDSNRISGSIPAGIGELAQLRELHLENNELTGALPATLGSLTNLEECALDSNMFSGELPSTLSNLRKLRLLNVERNLLTGAIPEWLPELSSLWTLGLSDNRFQGQIPRSLGNCSSLTCLRLDSNALTGPVPTSLAFGLRRLVQLSLPSGVNDYEQFEMICSRALPGLKVTVK